MRAQAHTHTPAVTLNRRVQTLLPSTLNSSTVLTTSESSLLPNRLYRPIHPVTKKGSVRTTRVTCVRDVHYAWAKRYRNYVQSSRTVFSISIARRFNWRRIFSILPWREYPRTFSDTLPTLPSNDSFTDRVQIQYAVNKFALQ